MRLLLGLDGDQVHEEAVLHRERQLLELLVLLGLRGRGLEAHVLMAAHDVNEAGLVVGLLADQLRVAG